MDISWQISSLCRQNVFSCKRIILLLRLLLIPTFPGDWVGVDVSRGVRRQARRGQDHLLVKGLRADQGGKAAFLQSVTRHSPQVQSVTIFQLQKNLLFLKTNILFKGENAAIRSGNAMQRGGGVLLPLQHLGQPHLHRVGLHRRPRGDRLHLLPRPLRPLSTAK